MDRLKIATTWLAGCSGCHMSFLDLDEWLFDLASVVDLVYSPVMDVKDYPEHVDVCLVEGAVANEDNLAQLRLIRQRTRILVAFGDCAITGNVTALRNPLARDEMLAVTYVTAVGDTVGTYNPERVYVQGGRPRLRLLRASPGLNQPGRATWDLEMHNVYRVSSSADTLSGSLLSCSARSSASLVTVGCVAYQARGPSW